MQTAATGYDLVLDPAAYTGIQLVETDDKPMDTIWHRDAMVLLIAAVRAYFRGRDEYLRGWQQLHLFQSRSGTQPRFSRSRFFFVKNNVDPRRPRLVWAVWQENGRTPDVVLELLSPTTENEDRTTKFTIYEQTLRVPEYFLYDPDNHTLEGFRLIGQDVTRRLQPNEQGWLWSEELGLWLGTWRGRFQGENEETWLRLYTPDGQLVLLEEEQERQRAEQEQQFAEQERQRAEQERLPRWNKNSSTPNRNASTRTGTPTSRTGTPTSRTGTPTSRNSGTRGGSTPSFATTTAAAEKRRLLIVLFRQPFAQLVEHFREPILDRPQRFAGALRHLLAAHALHPPFP